MRKESAIDASLSNGLIRQIGLLLKLALHSATEKVFAFEFCQVAKWRSFIEIKKGIEMDFNCYDAMPSNDEIAIVDQEAARAAATSLAPDVEILGLVMSVPEVFRRGDMKIVRINLLDGESNDLRAVAARIYKDGEVHEFVCKL